MSLKKAFYSASMQLKKFSFLTLDLGNGQESLGVLEEVSTILSAEN